jgi:hypothetical protein
LNASISLAAAYFSVLKRTPEPWREERNRDTIAGVFDDVLYLILHTEDFSMRDEDWDRSSSPFIIVVIVVIIIIILIILNLIDDSNTIFSSFCFSLLSPSSSSSS